MCLKKTESRHCSGKWIQISLNKGFTVSILGKYCERDIDECELYPNICQNGGTCNNLPGKYLCVCVNGWTGPHCEENIDDCKGNPCYNGGTCEDRIGYYFCNCTPGKTGKYSKLFTNSIFHSW